MAELSPPMLHELGLPTALEWLADQMKKHRLTVAVRLGASELPLTENQAILLFHSVRELLINATKHARDEQGNLDAQCGRSHVEDYRPGSGGRI